MNTSPGARALAGLGCVAVLCGGVSSASGGTIQWHLLRNVPPPAALVLTPASPTTTNLINFIAPTDGQVYANSCWASVSNGEPSISEDATNQTINVSFSPPLTNMVCPAIVVPVSGVDGSFGPLKAGTWTFNILQSSYAFTVTEAPVLLSIRALTNSSSLRISWPVSGDTYALEFKDRLSFGNWQAVTNAPVTSSNSITVQIDSAPGTRFFRLRRLSL